MKRKYYVFPSLLLCMLLLLAPATAVCAQESDQPDYASVLSIVSGASYTGGTNPVTLDSAGSYDSLYSILQNNDGLRFLEYYDFYPWDDYENHDLYVDVVSDSLMPFSEFYNSFEDDAFLDGRQILYIDDDDKSLSIQTRQIQTRPIRTSLIQTFLIQTSRNRTLLSLPAKNRTSSK